MNCYKFNLFSSKHLKHAKYIKCLGDGTHGKVKLYQCKNNNCDRLFVVKQIKTKIHIKNTNKLYKDKLLRKILLNEYTIGTLLNHENIIKTLDIDLSKNAIIFEYFKGIDFFNYIQLQKNNSSIENKIIYFKQIINGISYMHDLGIAHMDLKLENIIIDTINNKIKIIDFGHSKIFHDSTHINTIILNKNLHGSIPYIAPEEFLKDEYNPEKIDVWSCGIILYIIIYNSFPWYKATEDDRNYKSYLSSIKNNNNYFSKYSKLLSKFLDPNPNTRSQIKDVTF